MQSYFMRALRTASRILPLGLLLVIGLSLSNSHSTAMAQSDDQTGDSLSSAADTSAPQPASPAASPHQFSSFDYIIRGGDTLGSIAAQFGIDVTDLMKVNHINGQTELMVGSTLKIPNPFLTQMRELTARNSQLAGDLATARKSVEDSAAAERDMQAQVGQLSEENHALSRSVRMLPWWHALVYSACVVTLLALGVTALAVFQWFTLRRRFGVLAELNESLRRLDQRYKVVMSRAELRMQELYGRRRRGLGEIEPVKLPEEAALEKLDEQLREMLEGYIERLGGRSHFRRRNRLRDVLEGTAGSPVEARSMRR